MYIESFTETPPHLWLLEAALSRHGRGSEARLRVMGGTRGQQKKKKKRIFTKSGECLTVWKNSGEKQLCETLKWLELGV